MHDFTHIDESTSYCLHFVRQDPLTIDDEEIVRELRRDGVGIYYFDYLEAKDRGRWVMDSLADLLELENRPYERHGLRFNDDLITLAHTSKGAVIVIDNADAFLAEQRDQMLDIVEAAVRPLRHWLEQKKPYHICFQMEPNPRVRQIFGR